MSARTPLDCLVIGYYEPPFDDYEALIANYGRQSTAYRDLQFSFVDVGGRKMTYVDLLNHAYRAVHPDASGRSNGSVFLSGDIPNLAAVYLTSFLLRRGYSADYVNLFDFEREALASHLARDPVCVAITTTFYVLPLPVIEIVTAVRAMNRRVKIVIGGPLIGNYFRAGADHEVLAAICDNLGGDIYVVESQGEATLARLIDALKGAVPLARVPNIAYFDGGALTITAPEAERNTLDENTVLWSAFDPARLGRTIQTRTARSCAFKCSFCNYPTRAGKLSLASLDAVERELDSIRDLGNVRNVVFIDDTFNVPLPRFKDLCRLMIERRYGFDWFSYFRCSNADEEAIDLMTASGCKGVFLGIESGSPRILANMNKAATIEKYAAGIRMLRARGILTFGSFIVGFPGETAATVGETVDFIAANPLDYYRAQVWYCEPGTPIHRERDTYQIEGEGFVWTHATMTSVEAMRHIEAMFLQIDGPAWLPQWSFDFWIIPYLLGRGLTREQFRAFMGAANELLRLEIRGVAGEEKATLQRAALSAMTRSAEAWGIDCGVTAAAAGSLAVPSMDNIREAL